MNTIIAVTFIGILTDAFSKNPSKNTECNYKAIENFDSTRYLQITPIYSTYAKYGNLTVCRVFESITKSCDAVDINIYGYYQESGKIYYYEMVCSTTEETFNNGQYLADCKIVKDTSFADAFVPILYKLYMSVIDTDYENYAIIYTYISDEDGFEDNVEVLQKNPGASDKGKKNNENRKVKNALKKKGMKLEEFIPRNPTYCQNMKKDGKQ